MVILEEPYVSKLLINTIIDYDFPVLKNQKAVDLSSVYKLNLTEDSDFTNKFSKNELLYSNSENSIEWINTKLNNYNVIDYIDIFKNKFSLRENLKEIYPDFYFKEFKLEEIDDIEFYDLKSPFVIKPNYGFLSFNVFSVNTLEEWNNAKSMIKSNIEKYKNMFPENVISSDSFIIEEYIEGKELAVDAYFDKTGEPVILNILEHKFTSKDDMNDRLYITSRKLIKENYDNVMHLLIEISKKLNIKKFPIHIELRDNGKSLLPIEVNPMRFAGWCTTDVVYYAYGINPYEYYLKMIKPDWDKILKKSNDNIFSIIVIDKLRDYDNRKIIGFDYDKLKDRFSKVHELRKIDYNKYPIYGFLITETNPSEAKELEEILHNNLSEFIIFEE